MSKPAIYLLSVAGSDRNLPAQLGLRSGKELIGFVQEIVGQEYRVRGNLKLLEAQEDEYRGGRRDDTKRAKVMQRVLADDDIRAVVSLRGGAWLTRILSRVDFEVLKKRKNHLYIFGFSELTSLINITSRYSKVKAIYDISPGFLLWGLRNYALDNFPSLSSNLGQVPDLNGDQRALFALGWAKANFKQEFVSLWQDVLDIIEGNGSRRVLSGKLVQGSLKAKQAIKVLGGCLSVWVTLLGTPYQKNVLRPGTSGWL